MRLCSIDLTNFRNYDRLRFDIPDGTHVFHGTNAQGKTNLLEAIYLCTCARSHRTGRDEELVKHGCDFYRVSIQFVTDRGLNESVTLEYRLAPTRGGSPSRTVYYNDLEVARLSDMMGLFHAIIFAPEDLQIVKGGPSERRRFLDVLISRTDRAYFRDLQDFWRVIGQRNRLLKNLKANGSFKMCIRDRVEFFYTFNALFESGKNIVFTCDRPPQNLTSLVDRLRTRFVSGLTIDITPPDYETRIAILKNLAKTQGVDISHDILEYIADNITSLSLIHI